MLHIVGLMAAKLCKRLIIFQVCMTALNDSFQGKLWEDLLCNSRVRRKISQDFTKYFFRRNICYIALYASANRKIQDSVAHLIVSFYHSLAFLGFSPSSKHDVSKHKIPVLLSWPPRANISSITLIFLQDQ